MGAAASLSLDKCLLNANETRGTRGVVASGGGLVDCSNTRVENCGGSGLLSQGSSSKLSAVNCLVKRTGGYASAYCTFGGGLFLDRCTVSEGTKGYGLMTLHDGSFSSAKHCVVTACHWEGVAARWGGGGEVLHCCLGGNGLRGAWGMRLSTLSLMQRTGNDVASAGRAGCGFDSSFGAGNGDAGTSSVPPINRRQSTAMARHASLFQAEPLHGRVAQVGLPSRGLSAKHAQAKSSQGRKRKIYKKKLKEPSLFEFK